MGKRGAIKIRAIAFIVVLFLVLILQAGPTLSESIKNNLTSMSASSSGVGRGGGAVPLTTTNLAENNNYNMKPGRLKFEFDGKWYAVQLRRVKQDHVEFLVMTLDINRLDDITAYTIDNYFNLTSGERREIDINNDGSNDISIELDSIGKIDKIRSAAFSVKKINGIATISSDKNNIDLNEFVEVNTTELTSQQLSSVKLESRKKLNFLDNIINLFKELF
mgnify:FL=1